MKKWLIIGSFVLSACYPIDEEESMKIDERISMEIFGGNFEEYHEEFDLLKNQPVSIVGNCVGPCSIFLGLPDVCVSPMSVIGFYGVDSESPDLENQKALDHHVFGRFYPKATQKKFMDEWRLYNSKNPFYISGIELSRIDKDIELCREE